MPRILSEEAVEQLDRYPPFLRTDNTLQAVANAVGGEIRLLRLAMERLERNTIPITAEEHLEFYELMLGLTVQPRGTVVQTNLVPNPRAKVDIYDWVNYPSSVVSVPSRVIEDDGEWFRFATTFTGGSQFAYLTTRNVAAGNPLGSMMAVVAGRTYSVAADIERESNWSYSAHMYVQWWNSSGALISQNISPGIMSGSGRDVIEGLVAPAGATRAAVLIGTVNTVAEPVSFLFRNVWFGEGAQVPAYFDGDSPDEVDYSYGWQGAPHRSPSLKRDTQLEARKEAVLAYLARASMDGSALSWLSVAALVLGQNWNYTLGGINNSVLTVEISYAQNSIQAQLAEALLRWITPASVQINVTYAEGFILDRSLLDDDLF